MRSTFQKAHLNGRCGETGHGWVGVEKTPDLARSPTWSAVTKCRKLAATLKYEALAAKLEQTQNSREIFDGMDEGDVRDASVGQRSVEDRRPRRLGLGHKALKGNRRLEG